MENDITSVPFKDYMAILEKHAQMCNEAVKLGLATRADRKAAKGMDAQRVGEGRDDPSQTTSGDNFPFSVGS